MKKSFLILILNLIIETKAVGEELWRYWCWPWSTHAKITEKAINLLLEEGNLNKCQIEELKKYQSNIKEGSYKEDGWPWPPTLLWRPDNHCYDPRTGLGKEGHTSALGWAMGKWDPGNNKENEYDWYDALNHHKNGNKKKAYYALGHVCHLLQDVSVPGHTIPAKGKTHPGLEHRSYESFINGKDEVYVELPTSIIMKDSLDEFFKGIAEKSRAFGDRFRKPNDKEDPDVIILT